MDKIQATGFTELSSDELQKTEGGITSNVMRIVSGALGIARGAVSIASGFMGIVRRFMG